MVMAWYYCAVLKAGVFCFLRQQCSWFVVQEQLGSILLLLCLVNCSGCAITCLALHLAHAVPVNECLKLCIMFFQQGWIAYWEGAKHLLNNRICDPKNICLILLS